MTMIDASSARLGDGPQAGGTEFVKTNFEVYVCKQTFKFNAAHFVAYRGFREALHGHNYFISVRLLGSRTISKDGYLIDFGDVKKAVIRTCKRLNERVICPMHSDVIDITVGDDTVSMVCEDGAKFLFPKADCVFLPIVHATTEEMSIYLWSAVLGDIDQSHLVRRGIHTMEVTVAEAPGQESVFRLGLPKSVDAGNITLDVRAFIEDGQIIPKPCEAGPSYEEKKLDEQEKEEAKQPKLTPLSTLPVKACNGDDGCGACKNALSEQLQKLALAINTNQLCLPTSDTGKTVSIEDLQAAIDKQNSQ
uniref:6-pyruvoyltetrahydropterin synthase n=1 Tax=Craspedostauros australis TaxID=1486917 RepID=A0A7R9WZ69_9STRA|mmetsp:Transcript_333/g.920  ORF Transcript_333/g.920 Transcript_333/m.920 type:complete len:306 (+) Transcript_333:242-1159(+)